MNGIDISSYNDIEDWNALKQQGVQIAVQKATEGISYTDKYLTYRYPRMKAAGIKVTFYHFARHNDVIVEAQHFLSSIAGMNPDAVLFLDIEDESQWTKDQAINYVKAFINYVQKQGYKIGLYTGLSFYNNLLKGNIPDVPLWIASYGKQPDFKCSWQYTDQGRLNGAVGNLDLDNFQDDIFINKEDDIMDEVVLYYGDADVFAALIISQKEKCPLMLYKDYKDKGLKANKVIQVGGPGATAGGTDRFQTFKSAANLL